MKTVLFLLFAIAANAFAQSQPSTPSAVVSAEPTQQQRTTTQQPAAQDNLGAENQPVFVKLIPAETTKAEVDKAEKNRQDEARDVHDLTFWTFVLAGVTALLFIAAAFQIGLFWVQLKLMRQGIEDTADAARAAKRAADIGDATLIAAHRPWLMVTSVIPKKLERRVGDFQGLFYVGADITIKNVGYSPALNIIGFVFPFFDFDQQEKIEDAVVRHMSSLIKHLVYSGRGQTLFHSDSEIYTDIRDGKRIPDDFDMNRGDVHLLVGVSYTFPFAATEPRYTVVLFKLVRKGIPITNKLSDVVNALGTLPFFNGDDVEFLKIGTFTN